jgi:ribosomal protein S18 acetylase RimI-like enzyme
VEAPDTRVTLRPATEGDRELLFRVYASTREEELAPVPWTPPQKEAFLRMQFEAQDRWCRENYPGAEYQVILVDGAPAGRLYLHPREDEVRIMDIALLPEHRGTGVGTYLLKGVVEGAAASRKRLSIHVEKHNPARRLYERLGFRDVKDAGVYTLMEWRPG